MKKKFVAFGCKNQNSTHSYIHYAYQRAFEMLGWESYWIDNQDVTSFDFSDSLILTLGGWDNQLPVRQDCKYILHNCDINKYESVLDKSLILQVYTTDVHTRDVEKIDDFIYYQKDKNFGTHVIYQPWATDYLPYEITDIESIRFTENKEVNWVGSIWNDLGQGNIEEITKLRYALERRGISLLQKKVDYTENKSAINESYIAPAIQGKWQLEKGYIPCRIFKNISYGHFGITNSKYVNELFNGEIVFEEDMEKLVEKSLDRRNNITLDELNAQIRFIREKHTYVNRIENILKVL
jgi:hypothetical protein